MGRTTSAVAVLACTALLTACGDPLVVLGDSPGIMRITLGVGDSIGNRVDSLATRTRLTEPRALAFDPASGTLYAGDRGALRQVSGTTTRVARIFSVASNGRASVIMDAGGCTTAAVCVLDPAAFVIASNGSLIIADQVGHRILRYVPGTLTVLAGTGTAAVSADGAVASTSPIYRPMGVAVAEDGRIFFSEAGSSRVRVIAANGTLGTVAGTGVREHGGDGGPATAARLMEPAGLHLQDGVLYIADNAAHVIRRLSPDGVIGTVAGTPGVASFSGDGGPATAATLSRPTSVSVTPDGRRLFIADQANDRVRIVDLDLGSIATFAGTGSRVYSGNRRPAGQTSLADPWGVQVAGNGFLFISDVGHSVVWRTSVTY